MAVVVGMEGRPTPLHAEFDVAEMDRSEIKSLIKHMDTTLLQESGEARRNIILAALAELSSRYLDTASSAEPATTTKRKRAVS